MRLNDVQVVNERLDQQEPPRRAVRWAICGQHQPDLGHRIVRTVIVIDPQPRDRRARPSRRLRAGRWGIDPRRGFRTALGTFPPTRLQQRIEIRQRMTQRHEHNLGSAANDHQQHCAPRTVPRISVQNRNTARQRLANRHQCLAACCVAPASARSARAAGVATCRRPVVRSPSPITVSRSPSVIVLSALSQSVASEVTTAAEDISGPI